MTALSPASHHGSSNVLGIFLGLLFAVGSVFGQSSPPVLTWGAGGNGGSGTWDSTTADWFNGSGNVPWTQGDSAVFSGTAGTVSINGSETANSVTFSTAGYTVQNFFLDGTSSGGLTVETDANATISSSILGYASSNTPFSKTGSGVLTLPGQGPVFFSNVTVAAGEMRFTGTGSPGDLEPYILGNTAGAALTFAASSNQIGGLSGGGANGGVVRPNITSGNVGLSIFNLTGDTSFAGLLQDNGSATLSLLKSGSYMQTLTGANTYSGATSVTQGTLTLSGANGSALNTVLVTVSSGGTLLLDSSGAANSNRLASNLPITLNGGTLELNGNSTTATAQTLGALTFSDAATVASSPVGSVAATLSFASLSRQNNGTISFSGSGNITVAGLTNVNGIVSPFITVGADWATVNAGGSVSAYTGYVSNPASATGQDNLRLTSTGGGTTTLNKAQSNFNSLNLVNTGSAAAVLDLGAGDQVTLTSGGLLTSGSAGEIIQNGKLNPSGSELIVTNQAALTIASTIADGSAATTLTKSGAGTLVLTSANTYSGPTVIDQGILQAAGDSNLGTGSAAVLANGTLQASASFTSTKSLQGSGGTMDTNGFNVSFSGGNNTGSINKVGAGMLTLTSAVASVTLNAGILRLTNLAANNQASIYLYGGRLEASGSGVANLFSAGSAGEIAPGGLGVAATLTLGVFQVSTPTTIDFDLGSSATDRLAISSVALVQSQLLFRFTDLGGTRTGTAYPLLTFPTNGPGVSASEAALDPASTAAGYRGTFSVANGTLSVTFSAVPEPGLGLWLLGLVCLCATRLGRVLGAGV